MPRNGGHQLGTASLFNEVYPVQVGIGISFSTNNAGACLCFAYGGSVVVEVNVDTQRQRILDVDYNNFTFGVQIDSRIFTKLFPGK